MQINQRFGICLLAAMLGMTAAPVWADDDCEVPVGRWQSRDAVTQMARQKGWDLKRIKIDDGCYEIRGEDDQGQPFKAVLDPETLGVVKIKYRDRDGRRRDRDRHRDSDQDRTLGRRDAPGPAPEPAAADRKSSAVISVGGARIE